MSITFQSLQVVENFSHCLEVQSFDNHRDQPSQGSSEKTGADDNRGRTKTLVTANQLLRRNITPAQRKYLIGIQYKLEKRGVGDHGPEMDQNEPFQSTAEKIAEQHHVSRNLTPRQTSYLRGVRYDLEKNITGKHTGTGISSEKIANEYGVTARTIQSDAKFAQAVNKLPPEERAAALSGTSGKTMGRSMAGQG